MEGLFLQELKYSPLHSWVKVEGDLGIIGISDYAQKLMGELVFIELPPVGKELKKGDSFGIIESAKSVSDLFTPLSGKIIDVNFSLTDIPNMINKSVYQSGWIIKLKIDDISEIDLLLNAEEYEKIVKEENKT
ncbi:glycine cleavage system protein GcvH [bacterium]|nr:glycine cleavage system protein GcvH [bacterium]